MESEHKQRSAQLYGGGQGLNGAFKYIFRRFGGHDGLFVAAFLDDAAGQGSQNGQMYYAHLTRLSNAVAGVTHRRDATEQGLQSISTAEVMICLYIVDGMRLGLPYRQIYQNCKAAVLVMKGEKQ